jgi:hypothetical protein
MICDVYKRISTNSPDTFCHTWTEIEYCLDVCRATNGTHIETFKGLQLKFETTFSKKKYCILFYISEVIQF